MGRYLFAAVVFILLAVTNSAATAQIPTAYSVIDLGTLGGPFTSSVATGINNRGEVVGYSYYKTSPPLGIFVPFVSVERPFIYDGTMHDLGIAHGGAEAINDRGQAVGCDFQPNGLVAFLSTPNKGVVDLNSPANKNSPWGLNNATAINNSGQVAGFGFNGPLDHAFFYDKGKITDIGTLGGLTSFAYGINAKGQVVGEADLAGSGVQHAFLYDGTIHDLGTLRGDDDSFSAANAINASGQITGSSTVDDTSHAFSYDGTMHDLGALGGVASAGLAINGRGQITGTAILDWNDAPHAFLYSSGAGMVDLNSLIDPASGWVLESATAINDSGEIAGNGIIDGQEHAFLLTPDHGHASLSITPVPEPASILLTGIGFLGLLAGRNRFRPSAILAI